MSRLIDVAKAARYLGINRTELQKLVRKGDLQTFEGKVDLEQLKSLYPALAATPPTIIEDTEIIRDGAYARRIQSLFEPTKEELDNQVRRLRVQLSVARAKATSNQRLVDDLLCFMGSLQADASIEQKQLLERLNGWLRDHTENKREKK